MNVTRRQILVTGGAAAVAAGIGLVPQALIAASPTVFYLNPEWGTGPDCRPDPHLKGPDCHACAACHGNANKLFTTSALANTGRAHPRCKCLVQSRQVTERDYVSYFGPPAGPQHRDEFDPRRDKPFLPDAALSQPTATRTPGGPAGH